ncbi:MAG: AAA family ATPase [Alphaproteobacteria bacterium]|nr:AAA family ATPase [Alphaproteobacteria bacterium]
MIASVRFGAASQYRLLEVLWDDGERVFCRTWRQDTDGTSCARLVIVPATDPPTPDIVGRLEHENKLRDHLDSAWALRAIELVREGDRTMLVVENADCEPLNRYLGEPMEVPRFLRLAIAISSVLSRLHERGLVHRDIKPSNILINIVSGQVWLTGFGITSRLPRQRQAPAPLESVAGTLAYMAPEQTGRMNRSIDARSDLYSLGVTFYQMLTGGLPFTASDPMEWVHCHIAKKPVAPNARVAAVPAAISDLILKLLAKTAEERYQTVAGLERDLRHCLAAWEAHRRIDSFPLGQQDTPDRLLIPEKLYGREREIETLLGAFDRVVKSGRPELILVSGYSGIGKSAVINELHKALVPSRALFVSGKFDQRKRDIPYATLGQALQSLIRPLLSKSDAELIGWGNALREALGSNGQLVIDVVPELKLLIGEQPPVQELPPQQAQRRLHLVFRRFINVFARPEHPLALFLDDLQWLDAATLDMLVDLLTHADVQNLLVIGAYRDNEVDSAHPLMRKLDAIRSAGAFVQRITLAPLVRKDLGRLVADTLSCTPPAAAPLARLVHNKTGGNPFFAIQFISALADEGLLHFDHDAACWRWDLDRLNAKGYTDNVANFMVGKLTRLPLETQAALQQLACLGHAAEIGLLAIVLGKSEDDVHSDLWAAVRLELVERLHGSYKFVHDRILEAAYSLMPERLRAEAHLRIGRLLVARARVEGHEETIFEIVNQLNRGATLIMSPDERERLAEFNLLAGQRAKASAAYASALTYLAVGAALLPDDRWDYRHELAFALELQRAECEFLTGAQAEAEVRLVALSDRAADRIERATVACLRMDLYMTRDQPSHAITVGLDYLRQVGTEWSPHPTDEVVRREYELVESRLGGRSIEECIDLPLMSDPDSLAILDVLIKIAPIAVFTDHNLLALAVCRVVNLSLERGNCDGSCLAYVMLGMVAGVRFADYHAGYRFGQLGYDLVEKRGLKRFQARTYQNFGVFVLPWTRHVRDGRDIVRLAFEAANRIGDLTFAAYACHVMTMNLIAGGDPLLEVQREAERGFAFAQNARFGLLIDITSVELGLVATLRGLTLRFGSFDSEQFDELRMERRFAGKPDLAVAECFYWIRKLQARFLAGDHVSAIDASLKVRHLVWTIEANFEIAEYHFYSALSRTAAYDAAVASERKQYLYAAAAHYSKLKVWAANCPDNFENRAALVGAEIARIEGRDVEAMRLYEQAIRSAHANGFIHQEALANELAARFYAARGFERFASLCLQGARDGYLRWGADGKVRQLDEMYPHLTKEQSAPGLTSTILLPVDRLDLATVIKVSQAISGEVLLDKLIDTLMRTAIEYAGAERGLLILPRNNEYWIEAEATTADNAVAVTLRHKKVTGEDLPEPIFHYVLRTKESVLVQDASTEKLYSSTEYLQRRRARSVLCLPFLKQTRVIGLLYLENTLAGNVFTPSRVAILKLLASEAAISLENTRLYGDLREREARIRRLVDSNIIGIVLWKLDGLIIDANEAFLRIVGHKRVDLEEGRLRWTELTPAEWRGADDQAVTELNATGVCEPFEKEYFRKDGSRVPVLLGAATFDGAGDEGVAFVVDLTDRKQAEEAARENERRYHEIQMELLHANRVATMGQLSASIAHEVNQPIFATLTNAQTALRWLSNQPPNMDAAQKALLRVVRDGQRAGDVIGRIRALINKAPPQKENLNINDAILEVVTLARTEALKKGVSVQVELADEAPPVRGDRVQLQQVILNLVVNAIEAMAGLDDPPRELLVTTEEREFNGVLVSVRDSGPGVDAASLERIFDAFYSTKVAGLGMGLSICRSIIEAHGGRLWASANTPRGAVFQFTLPGPKD